MKLFIFTVELKSKYMSDLFKTPVSVLNGRDLRFLIIILLVHEMIT